MALSLVASGGGTVFIKGASAEVAILVIGALRYLVMGVLYLPLMIRTAEYKTKEFVKAATINSVMQIIVVLTWIFAVDRLQAITAVIIFLLIPVLIYCGSIIILKEKPSTQALAGTIIALAGSLLLLAEPIFSGNESVEGDLTGVVLALLSAIASAAVVIHAKKVLKISTATTYLCYRSLLVGVVFAILATANNDWSSLLEINIESWMYLAGFVIIAGVIGNWLFYASLKHMKAEDSSSVSYIEPAVGVILGILLLGETFTILSLIGSIVIVIGVLAAHPIHIHRLTHFKHPHIHSKH